MVIGDADTHAEQTSSSQLTGPLAGVRIVELGSFVAGSFATRLLADFGADVIKVEAPHRLDPLRVWGHHEYQGRTLWWPCQSRNKRLVTLDLRQRQGQELLLDLAAESDVVLENFRPGTLERWDLGYERLRQRNPGLILARISGYGQTGPYAARAGFAAVAEAVSGLRHLNGYPEQPPPRAGISLGDSLASVFAVHGVLMALYWRDARGGTGQVIDVSLVESCFAMLESAITEYDRLGVSRGPAGTGLGRQVPSNIFRSRDGHWVVIAANADAVFRRLVQVIGRPELNDERFAVHIQRNEHQAEIEGRIGEWVREHDAAEVDRLLADAGVPCGQIYTMADVFADPLFAEREMLIQVDDPELGTLVEPGIIPKLSATPGAIRRPAEWTPGADNDSVLCDVLGRSRQELIDLRNRGVI